jgi:hypothetical protein
VPFLSATAIQLALELLTALTPVFNLLLKSHARNLLAYKLAANAFHFDAIERFSLHLQ